MLLTIQEYYHEMDWDLFEKARLRVRNDPELQPYLAEIMDCFPVVAAHYYTVWKGNKEDLLKYGKGKKALYYISYKRYKQMEMEAEGGGND